MSPLPKVARLVEIKPTHLERLEGYYANAMTLTRNTRQKQDQVNRDSQEFADLEYVIDSFADVAASIREEVKALQAPPPELTSAAR